MIKTYLEAYRQLKQTDKEFTILFKAVGMDYKILSNRTRSHLRMNAAAYGSKQVFVSMLPTFAELGLLKMDKADVLVALSSCGVDY